MLIVNGENKPYEKEETIEQFLKKEGYRNNRIAVEVNEEIVAKAQYGIRKFEDGDKVEIIQFVGGG